MKPKQSIPPTINTDSINSIVEEIHEKHDSTIIEINRIDTIIKYVKEKTKQNSVIITDQSIEDDINYFSKYINTYCGN